MRIEQSIPAIQHNAKIKNPDQIPEGQAVKAEKSRESYTEFSHKLAQELSIDEKNWIKLIEQANKAISGANRTFEYSIHEETKQIMVKVMDSETKQVIREIPPEKILNMVAKFWEMAGIMVDERR